MKKITLGFIVLLSGIVQAQLSVDNTTWTPAQLTNDFLLLPNDPNLSQTVFPLNYIYNKSASKATIINDQIAKWETSTDAGNLGLGANQRGVLLTTGKATVALGPNNSVSATEHSTTQSPIFQGDPDLEILSGGKIVRHVSILEFDFVATGDNLSFDYVFASEEYPEYSLASFNDTFGFFLSGPGISGGMGYVNDAKNIALLSNGTTVTINNVNQVVNNEYYVSNGEGTTPLVNTYTQYDGFTKLLRANSQLQSGQTYHIKFAICHTADTAYDSAVFLKTLNVTNSNLGLKENVLENQFAVYPNPATNLITISNETNLAINEIKVIDVNGRIIKSEKYNNGMNVKFNISDINSGIYFLEINSSEGKALKRLIKN